MWDLLWDLLDPRCPIRPVLVRLPRVTPMSRMGSLLVTPPLQAYTSHEQHDCVIEVPLLHAARTKQVLSSACLRTARGGACTHSDAPMCCASSQKLPAQAEHGLFASASWTLQLLTGGPMTVLADEGYLDFC